MVEHSTIVSQLGLGKGTWDFLILQKAEEQGCILTARGHGPLLGHSHEIQLPALCGSQAHDMLTGSSCLLL